MSLRRLDNEDMDIEAAEKWNEEVERREANDEKGEAFRRPSRERPQTRKDPRIVNYAPVSRDTWSALIDGANQSGGIKLEIFAGMLLDALVDAGNLKTIMDSDGFQIDLLQMKTRRYFTRLESLEASISEYSEHPTDETAHMLMQQCSLLGVNFDDILARVKSDPLNEAANVVRSDPSTKSNQCVRWMAKLMKKHDYEIFAEEGNRLGNEAGFNKDFLRGARNYWGISSVLVDGKYVWRMPEARRGAMQILGTDEK